MLPSPPGGVRKPSGPGAPDRRPQANPIPSSVRGEGRRPEGPQRDGGPGDIPTLSQVCGRFFYKALNSPDEVA